ncbi:hypothetical protein NHF46_01860 [Arthrobacter alpinus]|nr:hypothetical protein [Arthrobacter alpinus]
MPDQARSGAGDFVYTHATSGAPAVQSLCRGCGVWGCVETKSLRPEQGARRLDGHLEQAKFGEGYSDPVLAWR